MYLAERDESHRPPCSLTADSPLVLALLEAVRPVPVPQRGDRRVGRNTYTCAEPGECSGAVRDRAQSHASREMAEAMPGRDVAGSCVDRHITVQFRLTGDLEIEDPRADAKRLHVSRPDRAKGADKAREPRAILRHMQCLRGSERAILR